MEPRRRRRDGVRSRGAGGSGRANRPRRPRADAEMAGTVREEARPLDETCDCEACTTFSRGYLRHLFQAEELLGLRLLSLHNVRYLIRLAGEMRAAIREGNFARWADAWRRRYLQPELA